MRIREAAPRDSEELAALLAELGYPAEPDRVAGRLARFRSDPASRVLVAEEDGRLVGFAAATVIPLAHEDASWCRLSALVVSGRSRRGGIGSALVAAVEEDAREHGCRWVEVTSGERPDREAAHRFYAALGYEQVSKRYLKEL